MIPAALLGEFMLSGIPATLALASVATIGYLIGRNSRLPESR
jgi:hypothetical protein